MIKALPDKWVRRALFLELENLNVNGVNVPLFDYRTTDRFAPENYIIISTQSNILDKSVKCGVRWENSTLIEIVTTYQGTGNTGSRLLADDITTTVLGLTYPLALESASGLTIENQTLDLPNDLATITPQLNVFRKFIRYELLIN